MVAMVKGKLLLPIILMVVFCSDALAGFAAFEFQRGLCVDVLRRSVFPRRRIAWWLPLLTMFITDELLGIIFYYHVAPLHPEMIGNYIAYIVLIWLGRRFSPKSSFISLLGGGLLGAIFFYFITNTAAWFFNTFQSPEYTKTFTGWLIALTKGTNGWPQTWEFFSATTS